MYTPTDDVFPNPERGFYHQEETDSNDYLSLNEGSLRGYRENEDISLILRLFYMDDFVTDDISQTYLDNMQTDFDTLRSVGLKAIIRFAYNTFENADAEKAQVLSHIQQLEPVLRRNQDVIATVQAGFVGPWGEWHSSTNFASDDDRREVLFALLDALPNPDFS